MKLRSRFLIGTVIAAVTGFGVWLAFHRRAAMRQRDVVAWIKQFETGLWRYDSQNASLGFQDPLRGSPSNAAEAWFGPEYVHDIEEVLVSDRNLDSLDPIAGLSGLRTLSITTQQPLDLAPLESLPKLSTLTVTASRIDSLVALKRCSHLNYVILDGQAIDANELAALRSSRPDMQIQVLP